MNSVFRAILCGLLALPLFFYSCLSNKYRINLDRYTKIFQYQTSEVEIYFLSRDVLDREEENTQAQDKRYSFMRLGGNELLCGFEEQDGGRGSNSAEMTASSWEGLDSHIKNYLKKSKISWLMERCFIYTKRKDINNGIHTQVDVFEICIGISIRHKKQIIDKETNSDILESQFNLLGDYKLNEDVFYQNGTIIQYYNPAIDNLKGDSGYSASIEFLCSYKQSGIRQVSEDVNRDYKPVIKVEFMSPSFCDWRVDESKNITTLDKLESLLLPLENRCQNFTDSRFWNYELCNLYAVSQFKRGTSAQELRLFCLGVHPGTAEILNKTEDLDKYLSKNLISNIVSTVRPGNHRSLLGNVTATIEPRNKNEPVHGNYVHSKYVMTVKLVNGTYCEENNQPRSIKLVFECPDNFESFPDYFRIVNVAEDSTCSYEMLILTPVICSHPLLMPPPISRHRKIKCMPRSLTSNKSEALKSPRESQEEELVAISHIDNQFEAVNTEYVALARKDSNSALQFFTMDASPRIWSSGQANPKFSVGQIVQHSWWNYYGVVIGWDWKLNAPDQWTNRTYQKYSSESREKPHYLLLIHQQETLFEDASPANAIPSNLTHSYVPEIALVHVPDLSSNRKFSNESVINNMYLRSYFSHWSKAHQRFIPLSNSTLWETYPSDFKDVNKRDEL